jgi:hypothetical protein
MKSTTCFAGLLLSCAFAFAQAPEAPAQSAEKTEEQAPEAKKTVSPELVAARKQLAILRARHGENHPAVEKQMIRIAELQKKPSAKAKAAVAPTDKAGKLEAAKEELAALRARYTDEHPLVKNQLRKIAALEAANAQ